MKPRARTGHRLLALSVAVLTWAAAMVAWGVPAVADNWGSSIDAECNATASSQCIAKKGNLKLKLKSTLPGGFITQIQNVVSSEYNNNSENTNDIEFTYVSSSSNADVTIYWVASGSGNHAWTQCLGSSSYGGQNHKRWCNPQKIVYNSNKSSFFDGSGERRAYACHELGHIFGLRHKGSSSQTCMRTLPISSYQTIGLHNIRCIVQYYPNGVRVGSGTYPHAQNCPI